MTAPVLTNPITVVTVRVPGSQGPIGLPGPGNTVSIGTVTTTSPGTNATATMTGTSPNQTLNLTIPNGATGPANSLAVGTVTTGAAGSNAAVTITGTAPSQTINLTLPRGDKGDVGNTGPANTLAIGTVTTGAAGSSASATVTGTAPNQTLNLTIPRGTDGATGPANTLAIGTVTTGAAGSSASATVTGTAPNQTLNLTIPRGDTGATAVDATTTSKGSIQLAGDLGGTAAAPTVINGANHTHADLTNATSSNTASTLVKRDSNSRFQSADPSAAQDVSTKNYTDTQIATRAPTTHSHTASQISDSTTVGRALIVATDAAAGRTAIGAGTASTKSDVGLGNVDNTSDVNKPVSTAQAAALTSFGRDRGSGTTLPSTDLRRGDTFYHSGWACMFTYNGSGWRQDGDIPVVASNTARAGLPTNVLYAGFKIWHSGLVCEQIYDGSVWRFRLAGSGSYSTDTNGAASLPHNAGQAPRFLPVIGLGYPQTEAQAAVVKVLATSADSSNIYFKFYRTDQSASFNNPGLAVAWYAEF